jgi:hypothetical protein
MEYKTYHRDIVMGHSVQLLGWPHTKLQSPSSLGNSLPVFVKILEALNNGSCRFEELSEKDVAELDEQHQAKIASGELPDAKPRKIRSDAGKPKKRKEVRESDLSDSSDSSDDNERVPKKKRRLRSPSVLNVKSKAMITDTEDE